METNQQPVLDNLLGAEQKANFPGRFISECTRNTYDSFHSAKQNNLPGIILLVDFGDNFKQWIKILLGVDEDTNFSAVTVINGSISKPLSIQQDCCQGDPIAKYLLIMAIEILTPMLKNSKIRLNRGPHTFLTSMRQIEIGAFQVFNDFWPTNDCYAYQS